MTTAAVTALKEARDWIKEVKRGCVSEAEEEADRWLANVDEILAAAAIPAEAQIADLRAYNERLTGLVDQWHRDAEFNGTACDEQKKRAERAEAQIAEQGFIIQQTQIDRDTWRSKYHEAEEALRLVMLEAQNITGGAK